MKNKNILIIGAGIHGITLSLELGKKHNIYLIDENSDILMGSSNGTHNRIHLGYHYPRSIETILECQSGYDFYMKEYKDCLVFPDFYYLIEKNSLISSGSYKRVMNSQNLNCETSYPEDRFLSKKLIKDCFKVEEACFDISKLKERFKVQLESIGVNFILDYKIESAKVVNELLHLESNKKSPIDLEIDLIINCTYTFSNNVLKIFNIENYTEYEFEETEIAVVVSDMKIPAMTIMDGPFISILPYGASENKYIVYDVENSVRTRKDGFFFEKSDLSLSSNWEKMLNHGKKYFPFIQDVKYSHSIYSHRPIPKNIEGDSRATRIIKEDYPIDFYSIKEGKFISAPTIATEFSKMIDSK